MDWRDQNRMIELERLLDEAVDLLREHGSVDPVTQEPNETVRKFLDSPRLREAVS